MKTKMQIFFVVLSMFLCDCSHRIVYSFCDQYTNTDSLREELIVHFDVHSYNVMLCCCPDSNMSIYAVLLTDSAPNFILSSDFYGASDVNDTIKMYYLSREFAKNDYWACSDLLNLMLFDDDSIYSLLRAESYPAMLTIAANERTGTSALADSLALQIWETSDGHVYNQLRTLLGANQLLPIAMSMAENTRNPIACYDAYMCYISGYADTSDIDQQQVLGLLVSSAEQHYAPASFLLANMCLSGETMPRDTIRGKHLLRKLGVTPRVPFWRYAPIPPVYEHLLYERALIMEKRGKKTS